MEISVNYPTKFIIFFFLKEQFESSSLLLQVILQLTGPGGPYQHKPEGAEASVLVFQVSGAMTCHGRVKEVS